MARARLIKPAFHGDVVLSEVCRDARLLYVGLWGLMDRRGLMEYHPKLVKRDLLPYDDDATAAVIEGWVADLARIRRIHILEHSGKRYLYGPYLLKHQSFNVREKPNGDIPDAVLGMVQALTLSHPKAPDLHDTDTVPVPDEHETGTPEAEAEAETEAEAKTEAVDDPTRARVSTSSPSPETTSSAASFDAVCDRLELGPPFRAHRRKKHPDEAWLADTIAQFEIEHDAPGNRFRDRPLITRASEFLEARWNKRAAQPPEGTAAPPAVVEKPCVLDGHVARGAMRGKPVCGSHPPGSTRCKLLLEYEKRLEAS